MARSKNAAAVGQPIISARQYDIQKSTQSRATVAVAIYARADAYDCAQLIWKSKLNEGGKTTMISKDRFLERKHLKNDGRADNDKHHVSDQGSVPGF